MDTVISIDLQKIDINDISILLYVYALLHSLDMLFPGVRVINFVEAYLDEGNSAFKHQLDG